MEGLSHPPLLIQGCGGDQSPVEVIVGVLVMNERRVLMGKGKEMRDGITPQKQIDGLSGEIL